MTNDEFVNLKTPDTGATDGKPTNSDRADCQGAHCERPRGKRTNCERAYCKRTNRARTNPDNALGSSSHKSVVKGRSERLGFMAADSVSAASFENKSGVHVCVRGSFLARLHPLLFGCNYLLGLEYTAKTPANPPVRVTKNLGCVLNR